MASIFYQLYHQLKEMDELHLFRGPMVSRTASNIATSSYVKDVVKGNRFETGDYFRYSE